MSYSHFSTGNGDYWLIHARHDNVTDELMFHDDRIKTLDAIVLEDVGLGSAAFSSDQYTSIINAARENNVHLYTIDIAGSPDIEGYVEYERMLVYAGAAAAIGCTAAAHIVKRMKKMTRRKMLGLFGGVLAGLGIAALGFAPKLAQDSLVESGEASGIAKQVLETETSIIKTEAITMRNAVSAKKAEEFLAPMLAERLGRKPRIALVYGAYHVGMQDCIEDRDFRNDILAYFSDVLRQGRSTDAYENMLNNVYEFILLDYGFDMIKHETGLF